MRGLPARVFGVCLHLEHRALRLHVLLLEHAGLLAGLGRGAPLYVDGLGVEEQHLLEDEILQVLLEQLVRRRNLQQPLGVLVGQRGVVVVFRVVLAEVRVPQRLVYRRPLRGVEAEDRAQQRHALRARVRQKLLESLGVLRVDLRQGSGGEGSGWSSSWG